MKTVILPFFVFIALTGFAQDTSLDHLMSRRVISCDDIFYNAQYLISKYYTQGNSDSIRIILDYWQKRCGLDEKSTRLETLLNIHEKKFSEETYKGGLLDLLLTYRSRYEMRNINHGNLNSDQQQLEVANKSFDEFTAMYASEIKLGTQPNSLEYLICEFYANNFKPLLTSLSKNSLSGTTLQQSYNQKSYDLKNLAESHTSFLAEYWIPTQQAKILGPHPGLGLQLGYKKKKLMIDLTLLFRFIKSKNYYEVYAQDSLFRTRHFFGGYIGAEIGYELWRRKNSEFDLIGGIGYDGFDAVESDDDAGIKSVSIGSLNLNGGLGYRYYYRPQGNYIGFQLRFNAVNYYTRGGTNLTGDTFSLRFIWGFSGNYFRDSQSHYLND